MIAITVLTVYHCSFNHSGDYVMTFFYCTADLVGQLNGNGQKGMPQIGADTTGTVPVPWAGHFQC